MRALTETEVNNVVGGSRTSEAVMGGAELWVTLVAGAALTMSGVGTFAGLAILGSLGAAFIAANVLSAPEED